MNSDVRSKLEMATRAQEFCRAHPSDDAGYLKQVANLEELLQRAEALAAKQRAGQIAEHAGAARRMELREQLHTELLRHLVRVGELAAKEYPELIGKFQLPSTNATNKTYLVAAKAMLAEGQANKEKPAKYGLSDAMLVELGQAIQEFETTIESGSAGRESHVGARADLDAVAAELVRAVEVLNTFNRRRFRGDAELRAAWDVARTVIGPRTRRKAPGASEGTTPTV